MKKKIAAVSKEEGVMGRPLTLPLSLNYQAVTEILESVCNENERDAPHLVGKPNKEVKLSADVLAKYAGTYEVREGLAAVSGGRPLIITLMNGRLYQGAFPLIPQSASSATPSPLPPLIQSPHLAKPEIVFSYFRASCNDAS